MTCMSYAVRINAPCNHDFNFTRMLTFVKIINLNPKENNKNAVMPNVTNRRSTRKMGMSASQTRVLMLTARQNDLEYQAQQILQAKLAASRQAEDAAATYNEKISNTHFVTTGYNENGEKVQENMTAEKIMDAGYYIVDTNGSVVVPESGKYSQSNFENHLSEEDYKKFGFTKSRVAKFTSCRQLNNDDGGADSYIKQMLEKGEWTLCRQVKNNEETVEHKYTTPQATGSFTEVYYTADDAQAEAEYNAITKKLETLEKKLDMQMEQIETERNAVKTERESVEQVVKDNVEKTFKTFG